MNFNFIHLVTALVFLCANTPHVLALQNAGTNKTAMRYDLGGRVVGEILPDPDGTGSLRYSATRNTYNSRGLLSRVETGELAAFQSDAIQPKNWSGFTRLSSKYFIYDNYHKLIEEYSTDSVGNKLARTQYSYTYSGLVDCKAVRMNPGTYSQSLDACSLGAEGEYGPDRITQYTYNTIGLVTHETRALGTDLEQVYRKNTYDGGRLESITDANGNTTNLEYDTSNRLEYRIYPDNSSNRYEYDNNGNIRFETKRNGARFEYRYDDLNRMTDKIVPNQRNTFYGYDLRGLALYSRYDSHSGIGITNSFDGLGNLTSSTTNMSGTSRKLSSTYDKNGNRTKLVHPNNSYAYYFFDKLNRAYRIRALGSTSVWINYDKFGRADSMDRNYSRNGATTRFDFDAINRMQNFEQDFSSANDDLINTFTYTPASQVASINISNDQYYYFGDDNRKGKYEVNNLNQYTKVNGKTLTYDANANLTNDGAFTYNYDNENRLIQVSGGASATLVYDPLGRLAQTTINGATRYYLYDGDALVSEYTSSSSTTPANCYIHGDQVDQPLIQFNTSCSSSTSTRRLLHADHQGSIIAHSNTSASVLSTNSYDNFGIPGIENEGRFGYTGQIWFKELGLYHYKARMYSPTLGRFLQTDPIFYEDDMNMYAYVGNDPMNMRDPTGLSGCSDMGGQGLSGSCMESSNFKESKDGSDTVVSNSATDSSAASNMSSLESQNSEKLGVFSENGNGEVSFGEVGSKTTEKDGVVTTTSSIPSSADAVGHSHPENGGSVAPGPKDDSVVNGGRPNYIYQNGRVVVVEKSGGQFRVRGVSGSMTRNERRETKRSLNKFQRRGR